MLKRYGQYYYLPKECNIFYFLFMKMALPATSYYVLNVILACIRHMVGNLDFLNQNFFVKKNYPNPQKTEAMASM